MNTKNHGEIQRAGPARWVWLFCALWAMFPQDGQAQSTSSLTRVSSFEYDTSGLLFKEVVEPDRPDDCLSTTYTYDARGNKTGSSTAACAGAGSDTRASAATARSSTTVFGAHTTTIGTRSTYNVPAGQFPSVSCNAIGQCETRSFDPRFGVPVELTGPNGLRTQWGYDNFGRKNYELRADNTLTIWRYDYCSQVFTPGVSCPTLPGANTPAYVFTQSEYAADSVTKIAADKISYVDAQGRVLRTQTLDYSGAVVVQDTTYNALGQVVASTQPYVLGQAAYISRATYDALGRPLTQTSPDPFVAGGVASVSYAYSGLRVTVTNPQLQRKTTVKNILGQTAQVIDHDGNQVLYRYNALGQLVQTNAAGQISTLTYDQRGRKIGMSDPAMGVWSYAYNAFGELVRQTDSLAQTSTMAYDMLGRLIQRSEPDLVSTWYHDKDASGMACGKSVGKLCEARANNGYRRLHTYDSLGRNTSTATAQDSSQSLSTMSLGFDANTGRVSGQTWPTGYYASYRYGVLGYLQQVSAGGSGAPAALLDILSYDSQGRITSYKQGGKVVTNKTYEPATGRLTQIQAQVDGQSAGSVFKQNYTYDSLSNLTSRSDANTGVQEGFGYDNLNRLTSYTSLGGSVSPPSTVQVVYDARGNITYKSDVGRYWYDGDRPNRLTNITLERGELPLSGTRALSYVYDDYKAGASSQGTTLYVYARSGAGTIFAPVAPGAALTAVGGADVDRVYVGPGSNVDATRLGGSVDFVYMKGKWADYSKELLGSIIRFKRDFIDSRGQVFVETVRVSVGTGRTFDRLVFADGAVPSSSAQIALLANAQVGINGIADYDAATTSPQDTSGIVTSANVVQSVSTNGVASGVSVGNGNLMYTVSHDSASGKHTVRWESYTSFNMPSEIRYGNIGASEAGAVNGASIAARAIYSCAAGQWITYGSYGGLCLGIKTEGNIVTAYGCPAGWTSTGSTCVAPATAVKKSGEIGFIRQYATAKGVQVEKQNGNYYTRTGPSSGYFDEWGGFWVDTGPSLVVLSAAEIQTLKITGYRTPQVVTPGPAYDESGPQGYIYSGGDFYRISEVGFLRAYTGYYPSGDLFYGFLVNNACPTGATQKLDANGQPFCDNPQLAWPASYGCPAGKTAVGTGQTTSCQTTISQAVSVSYSCPSGYGLSDKVCKAQSVGATSSTSDRTLSFAYGPEHQRVRQVAVLSNSAPTSLMGGSTWYLHGDNNALLFEKELKANGITEQRHYLQAAGMTFALAVVRTGPGLDAGSANPAKRPTQLSYFQQDHLGSIAAVTDQTGAVTERLAYDPWGKRRYPNGLADNADSVVGVNTERGYTLHEHLDEIGVIHMNGRVYDPLIKVWLQEKLHNH